MEHVVHERKREALLKYGIQGQEEKIRRRNNQICKKVS